MNAFATSRERQGHPPVAQERLQLTADGQVRLTLRRPWREGTTALIFDPVEVLGRLAVLVPRPRINLALYRGVLEPRAAWRVVVVPRQAPGGSTEESAGPGPPADPPDAPARAHRRARGALWAALMQRTFGFDVLGCPRCGGRLRLVALIEEAAVTGAILRHLGVPAEVPAPRPAHAPPLPLIEARRGGGPVAAPEWVPC